MSKSRFKRITAAAVAMVMLLSMTACGGSGGVDSELSMAEDVEKYLENVDQQYAYDIAETLGYDEKYLDNEMGFRTAGSDAEHAAADYLVSEMEKLGLEEIEKVPVTVDKWQFNDASFTIEGTDVDFMPASYATNGTDENGITAEIVDVGSGLAADYKGLDVKGKIVVAGVDQWNEFWIDSYINEAYVQGAAAIMTYSYESGYGSYSDDMINMQDLCAEDLMPCVSISRNQYKEIKKAIEAGNTTATLTVDNEMVPDGGISYNVVGKIKGASSDQQIILSGHYDMYFNGFQDDSCAIGLALGVAKAMKDSGYEPANDIVFVCHGAEEWGAIDTQFDYTIGAWEMINTAHPEWAGKTLAMLNFELPAYYDGATHGAISAVPEFATLVNDFVEETGLCVSPSNDIYPEGMSAEALEPGTMEDGVSYRGAGVPYFLNGAKGPEGTWYKDRYHTVSDDKDTYNADVMTTNMNTFGALAMYIDQTPALQLDLTAACDDMEEALAEKRAKNAGADIATYEAAISDMRNAAEDWNVRIADVNDRYEQAVKDGASEKELDEIRSEGKQLNQTTLAAFKTVQDDLLGIILTAEIAVKHVPYQDNIKALSGIIKALEEGKLSDEENEDGALDLAWMLNGGAEYYYYYLTPEGIENANDLLNEELNRENLFWGIGEGFEFADTSDATMSILEKAKSGDAETSYEQEIAVYGSALEEQRACLKATMEAETEDMLAIAEMLK